jgi:hypothetical protein
MRLRGYGRARRRQKHKPRNFRAGRAAANTICKRSLLQHPTDLAGLLESRAVTASETERGRTWDENKMKTDHWLR